MKPEDEFMEGAHLGDELVVRTRVTELGRAAITFHQVASAEACGRAVWGGLDEHSLSTTGGDT